MIEQARQVPGMFAQNARGYLASLVVLGSLGGVFLWGHEHHWDFASMLMLADHGEHSEEWDAGGHVEPAAAPSVAPPASPSTVRVESPQTLEKIGLETQALQKQAIESLVVGNGVVGYDQTRYAELSSRVPGTVWRVEKKVGEMVDKGEVLAIIESVDVGKAKAEFMTAVANVDIKTKLLDIVKPLAGAVPMRQIKEAEAQVREARIRLYNAHQALVNLGLPIDTEEARALSEEELANRVQFLGLPTTIAEKLDPATTTGNLIPLLAPFDGVVVNRHVVLGEMVNPNEPQFVVADTSTMWIHLDLRIEDASKVSIGQDIFYKPDGVDQVVKSKLTWVSSEADEKTRTVEVRGEAPNPILYPNAADPEKQRLLHAHVFGAGKIVIDRREGLVLPKAAVQYEAGTPLVFVKVGDLDFDERRVEVGLETDTSFEIVSGLREGDEIVTVGSHLLKAEVAKRKMIAAR